MAMRELQTLVTIERAKPAEGRGVLSIGLIESIIAKRNMGVAQFFKSGYEEIKKVSGEKVTTPDNKLTLIFSFGKIERTIGKIKFNSPIRSDGKIEKKVRAYWGSALRPRVRFIFTEQGIEELESEKRGVLQPTDEIFIAFMPKGESR